MMKRIASYILLSLVGILLPSCVFENDMSYPVISGEFTVFEVEGSRSVTIDKQNRRVDIVLDELSDITAVKILDYAVSEGTEIVGVIPEVMDLTRPQKYVLRTYQDYEWTISATQPIDRYVVVDNQIGDAEFNMAEKMVFVRVTDTQGLHNVTFRSMKLEPEGAEFISTTGYINVDGVSQEETRAVSFPMTLNCIVVRYFDLEYEGEVIRWVLKVIQEKISLNVSSVNAWATKAQIKGVYDGNGNPCVQYRKDSDAEWMTDENITIDGINISADITGLEAGTDYQVRFMNEGKYSPVSEFRTEEASQLYNFSFDNWYLDGKVWYPYLSDSSPDEKVWDSANKGAANFIGSSTVPDDTYSVSGYSARMESRYAVIAFAAGNLYTGKFGKIAGVGAELDWGTPFTSRPTALKGYYSYSPRPIDRVKAPYEDMMGQMDKCQILVILADWEGPFRINTTAGHFVDVASDPHIIAHAVMESDEITDGFVEFTLPLEYRDLERKPKYVVVACCASYLGDYFTGGEGSLMYVDEFEFIY